jgi:predicted XRE-type DNA-binding protein
LARHSDAFDHLFAPDEAPSVRLQSRLMRAIQDSISREDAAERFGEARAASLFGGRLGDFDLDVLLAMADEAGVEVAVSPARRAA